MIRLCSTFGDANYAARLNDVPDVCHQQQGRNEFRYLERIFLFVYIHINAVPALPFGLTACTTYLR